MKVLSFLAPGILARYNNCPPEWTFDRKNTCWRSSYEPIAAKNAYAACMDMGGTLLDPKDMHWNEVAMRGDRRYWAAFKKTNVARGNITDYIQYGKFETNFFWYTHMEHGHLLPGNLTEFLLSEPFDGLYLNDCLEVYNAAYRNKMIMRGGTRYAPVWGATDCFQKDVYALCGRECVDCTNEHPDCPDGWELDHEGWCYRMSPDRKNWKDAVKDCASRGGELAHADSFTYDHLIRDVQAYNYIDRWGATKAPGLWIGVGWDIKYGNGWLYTNGTKIKWHNFLRDLPDNLYANGEFCVELRGERPLYEVPLAEHAKLKYYPHWNDAICSDEKHYVCRKRKDAPDDPLPEPDLHMFSSFKMTSLNMFLLLPALYTVLGQ